jgi:hypothetical protein
MVSKMLRSLSMFVRVLIILVLVCVANTAVSAQNAGANAIVFIKSSHEVNAKPYVASFAPGQATGKELQGFTPAVSNIEVSPNGQWYLSMGSGPQGGNFELNYGQFGQAPKAITAEAPFTTGGFINASFSADSRILAYVLTFVPANPKAGEARWFLGLLELASGKLMTFTDLLNAPDAAKPESGFAGLPWIIAWSADGGKLIVSAAMPFSDGPLTGLYIVDLTQVKVDAQGNAADFPTAAITKETLALGANPVFAPDLSQYAYTYNDPKIPLPPTSGERMLPFSNTLALFGGVNGMPGSVIPAEKDRIVSAFTWSPDSTKLYFAAGILKESGGPAGAGMAPPHLYTFDLTSSVVAKGPQMVASADPVQVIAMRACGNTAYYVSLLNTMKGPLYTLYSVPLGDPKAQATALVKDQAYIDLAACGS